MKMLSVSMVARARTLALLPMLDGPRQCRDLLFLVESASITYEAKNGEKRTSEIVSLLGADLSKLVVRIRPTLG
jgi:hypothetical protein